jgi:hypothetical protein
LVNKGLAFRQKNYSLILFQLFIHFFQTINI